MAFLRRKTLKSPRARMRRIDFYFELASRVVLVCFLLFVFIQWTAERTALRIDSIVIEGSHAVDEEVVRGIALNFLEKKYLWKIDRNNRFFYPKSQMIQKIWSINSRIESVSMSVDNRKTLRIKMTEYTPEHLWCRNEFSEAVLATSTTKSCFLVDDRGYVFADAPNYSGYPFDIYRTNIAGSEEQGSPIGLYMLQADEFQKVLTFVSVLEASGTHALEIEQLNEHDYAFKSEEPWAILWTSTRDPVESVSTIELAIRDIMRLGEDTKPPTSIDVRFGNKIFYK